MKHPIQPIITDPHGVERFKENKIVSALLDFGRDHGFGLNQIACLPFTVEDRRQLTQLIGYSVSGYGDLSYVTEADLEEVDQAEAARRGDAGSDSEVARLKAKVDALEKKLSAAREALSDRNTSRFG